MLFTLHSDAFFLSLRDINRHRSWLDFWKIQVNLVNFFSCTFGGDWGKYSQNRLTFGCLAFFLCLRFFLKKLFFPCKNEIFKILFKYICKSKISSEKFEKRTIQISWKIYTILKTVEFFNMWLFISKLKNLNCCICQKPHFCCSGLGQVSSWWINPIFV